MRTIVWGAPCSGKTSYVHENAKRGDVICDFDAIYQAVSGLESKERLQELKGFVLDVVDGVHDAIEAHDELDAWIISATRNKERLNTLVERFDAELVTLEVSREEAHRRCDEDGRPEEWHDFIDAWFDAMESEQDEADHNEPSFAGGCAQLTGLSEDAPRRDAGARDGVRGQETAFEQIENGVMMKDLRRVLPGNTKPYERFWQVQNAAESESGEGEIWFYGNISEYSWWEDDITPKMFKEDLDAFGGKPVTVRIHSAGGEVFAASAIRSMLMDYKGKVTARIEGLCASAATFVAMAADRVLMQDSAFFMIHDPWTLVVGGAKEMRQAAKMLTTLKKGIIETYQARTTLDENELSRMMDAETWMSAQDAVKYGFVDEVISDGLSAQFETLLRGAQPAVLNALRGFEHVPEAVRLAMEDFDGEDATVRGQETTNEQEAHGGTLEREDLHGEDATVRGQETTNEQIVDERVKAVNALRAKLEKIKEKANEI